MIGLSTKELKIYESNLNKKLKFWVGGEKEAKVQQPRTLVHPKEHENSLKYTQMT